MLTTDEKHSVMAAIDLEIENTVQLIAEYKDYSQPIAPENSIGRISRMDAIQNKSVTENALRHAESKLSALNRMKETIDDPYFGKCAKCGTSIPMGRLLYMPQSRFCVNCA